MQNSYLTAFAGQIQIFRPCGVQLSVLSIQKPENLLFSASKYTFDNYVSKAHRVLISVVKLLFLAFFVFYCTKLLLFVQYNVLLRNFNISQNSNCSLLGIGYWSLVIGHRQLRLVVGNWLLKIRCWIFLIQRLWRKRSWPDLYLYN